MGHLRERIHECEPRLSSRINAINFVFCLYPLPLPAVLLVYDVTTHTSVSRHKKCIKNESSRASCDVRRANRLFAVTIPAFLVLYIYIYKKKNYSSLFISEILDKHSRAWAFQVLCCGTLNYFHCNNQRHSHLSSGLPRDEMSTFEVRPSRCQRTSEGPLAKGRCLRPDLGPPQTLGSGLNG